ncbi:taperin-like isoform X2 [Acipenser ruthenus]|uniref:taperin-like isoform X2 n=1 Tax=Acipenser ruthenus TaxID=7906 RepID=UPI002741D8AA|nr:taperin-like isoform X2 [Acipenser ruthenus]
MSGSEVRLLRRDHAQGSSSSASPGPGARMPVWKREILERRKAKSGGAAAATEPGSVTAATSSAASAGSGPFTVNGEISSAHGVYFINQQHSATRIGSGGGDSNVPTAAELTAATHKDPAQLPHSERGSDALLLSSSLPDGEDAGPALQQHGDGGERLILQESLGSLQENPFIILEKERRRRRHQDRGAGSWPMQHILEMYAGVPGIKTIRAENIIIIESDPDYFHEGGGFGSTSGSMSELLDRRGSAVTEIRAREVLLYDSALSRSEENLSTLEPGLGPSQGRVSRMLQKFDRNYCGRLQSKSRSTEDLLLESEPRPPPRPKPAPLPKMPSQASSSPREERPQTVFQRPPESEHSRPPQSLGVASHLSKATPPSSDSPVSPLTPTSPPGVGGSQLSVSSYRKHFETGGASRTIVVNPRERGDRRQPLTNGLHSPQHGLGAPKEAPASSCHGHATVPSASASSSRESGNVGSAREEEEPRATPPLSPQHKLQPPFSSSSASTTPNQRRAVSHSTSSNDSFEIRQAPKPDMSCIPEGDIQARALANIRLQSKNSFTIIPKRHGLAAAAAGADSRARATAGAAAKTSTVPASSPAQERKTSTVPASSPAQERKTSTVPASSLAQERKTSTVPASSLAQERKTSTVPASSPAQERKTSTVPASSPAQERKTSTVPASSPAWERKTSTVPASSPTQERKTSTVPASSPAQERKTSTVPASSPAWERKTSTVPASSPAQERSSEAGSRFLPEGGEVEQPQPATPSKHERRPSVESLLLDAREKGRPQEIPAWSAEPPPVSPPPSASSQPAPTEERTAEPAPPFQRVAVVAPIAVPTATSPKAEEDEESGRASEELLPVTNIDDIVEGPEEPVPVTEIRSPAPSNGYLQRRTGNTFTVVPKRKPAAQEQSSTSTAPDPLTPPGPQGSQDGAQGGKEAPFASLGAMLKKRYPAVEEIQVIGGYQVLGRSCLSKTGSSRKKMKISFSESSLHTTFEYPSESSMMEGDPESDEEEEEEEEEAAQLFIPRASYPVSPGPQSAGNARNSGLSSYTPKHSVDFNQWQDHKHEDNVSSGDSSPGHADLSMDEVMLTPAADSSSLSDFSSEPALYF